MAWAFVCWFWLEIGLLADCGDPKTVILGAVPLNSQREISLSGVLLSSVSGILLKARAKLALCGYPFVLDKLRHKLNPRSGGTNLIREVEAQNLIRALKKAIMKEAQTSDIRALKKAIKNEVISEVAAKNRC